MSYNNKKRTKVDFSKHIVLETHFKNDYHSLDIWDLKAPDSNYYHRVRFINSCGILTVDGDFGRWTFNREFHPSADGGVSDSYWFEKLRIASRQEYSKYDGDKTRKELNKLIKSGLKDYGYEGDELKKLKEQFRELLDCVDDEFEYTYKAYRETDIDDYELIPFCKTVDFWLEVVFDAFEELCNRMKNE
jgi:hypothetical protein